MTEKQKDAIVEIQDLLVSIQNVIKKYGLEEEYVSCIALGFLDLKNKYVDEDGDERANMSLLSTFSVADEDELDDLLSYCVEAYKIDNEPEQGTIDWWIKNFGRDSGLN